MTWDERYQAYLGLIEPALSGAFGASHKRGPARGESMRRRVLLARRCA